MDFVFACGFLCISGAIGVAIAAAKSVCVFLYDLIRSIFECCKCSEIELQKVAATESII